jgi:hypothetical protein
MLALISRFLNSALRWVRYLYFLRFSLILWTFSLLLLFLNGSGAKTVTSGLFVPEFMSGYFCVAFFLVSEGFVALIVARLVAINGPDRWNEGLPPLLKRLLVDDDARWWVETVSLILSQVPTAIVFFSILGNSQQEGVHADRVWKGFLAGVPAAVFIWMAANAWFYLIYEVPEPFRLDGLDQLPRDSLNIRQKRRLERIEKDRLTTIQIGKNAARTMLFPRAWFPLQGANEPIDDQKKTLESATTVLRLGTRKVEWGTESGTPAGRLFGRILRWPYEALQWILGKFDDAIGLTGYFYVIPKPERVEGEEGRSYRILFEGHIFAVIATIVFITLCLLVWAGGAPVPAVRTWMVIYAFMFAGSLIAVGIVLSAGAVGRSFWSALWKWAICFGLLAFAIVVYILYHRTMPERFPVLATVIIVGTLACWALGAIAFFADRYRIPVITTILILTLLSRVSGLYGGHEEHYFSTLAYSVPPASQDAASAQAKDPKSAVTWNVITPTPAQVLLQRLNQNAARNSADEPLIIVTATGGGLHASAWTSAVLAQLENRFAREHDRFHDHVLLMSTVSGGSVGLLSYMREINSPNPDWVRMQTVAQCSSLEAVAWGLIFYDTPKAVVPAVPFLFPTSDGDGDLVKSPLFKDRTWALRRALARNLNNQYCFNERENVRTVFRLGEYPPGSNPPPLAGNPGANPAPTITLPAQMEDCQGKKPNADPDEINDLTLRKLSPDACGSRPAFTMNTTTVEQGARFLLANYRLPQYPLDESSGYPSQSFLDAFGCCKKQLFDLPLVTAAQMSATFPYISSAARAPNTLDNHSVHFVDGGYYDNDGTASALEFLRYALAQPDKTRDPDKDLQNQIYAKLTADHPLHILLIEIRNSTDPVNQESAQNTAALAHGGGVGANAVDWNLFDQVMAPLAGFWHAGHESVTGRNRAALSLLEVALHEKLRVHRIVFDDQNSEEQVGTDPLSWSLTPRQRYEVLTSSCPKNMRGKYDLAWEWFKKSNKEWASDSDSGSQLEQADSAKFNPEIPAGATTAPSPGTIGTVPAPKPTPARSAPAK